MNYTDYLLGRLVFGDGAGNSGSVEGVHYVTFMSHDGATVLYTRPVADGDDCADPVNRGLIEAPTRESDAQYDYTYSGWSLTSGGSVNSSALLAVTEDRTVYAVYSTAIKYYTVTYYDSDGTTVLKTESVAYGSMPSSMPTKDGYFLSALEPELAAVTGDASYICSWAEKLSFADATWADIARVSEEGTATNHFAVGDTKEITYTTTDGTAYTINVAIAGFNHDTLADGSGKAGITIVSLHTTPNEITMGDTKTYVYDDCPLKTYLEETVKTCLPSDLTAVIKPVAKGYSTGTSSYVAATGYYDIWALSYMELGVPSSKVTTSTSTWENLGGSTIGTNYSLFSTIAGITFNYLGGTNGTWGTWVRNMNPYGYNDRRFCFVSGSKAYFTSGAWASSSKTFSALYGFCV